MGLDKIYYTFYRLFGGNEDMEECDFNNNFNFIPADTIFIDGNFIIYQIFTVIEKDINEILKIILAVSHNSNRIELIEILNNILQKSPLKNYQKYFEEIFYLESLEKMISMLRSKTLDINKENNMMKNIIADYYIEYFEKKILNLHLPKFLKNIYLIFDGIPSGFKIIEQRRRRFKNFLESNLRKKMLQNKMINFPKHLSINNIKNKQFIFDYGEFVKNMITLNKSYGPSSNLFRLIATKIKTYLYNKNPKITLWYSGVNEYGEADFKIVHLCRICEAKNIVIHCSDFDFIILGSRLQNETTTKKFYLIRHFSENYLILNFTKLNERVLKFISNKFDIISDLKLIDDFYFMINWFGNDYIPPIKELTFDNNFLELIEIVGNNLWKNNQFLLNKIDLNINNLKTVLIKLFEKNNNNLKSYLKNTFFCNDIIKFIPDEFINLKQLDDKILEPYWLKKILELKSWDELYQKDIRLDLIQRYYPVIKKDIIKENIEKIQEIIKEKINNLEILNNNFLENKLDQLLKPYYVSSLGLKPKIKNHRFSKNMYDNLYYYYYYKSKNEINKKFSYLENRCETVTIFDIDITNSKNIVTEKNIVENYILTLNFINYKFYFPMDYTLYFYPFYTSPPLEWIINYINTIKININDLINSDDKIDSALHLLIISPNFLLNNNHLVDFFKENPNLIFLNNDFDIETNPIKAKQFNNYRNINLKKIKNSWDNYLLQIKNNILSDKETILSDKPFETKLLL